jgi:hypothetical protein
VGTTASFSVESYSANGLLQDASYTIPGVKIENPLETGKIAFNSFKAVPSNGAAIADYTVSIVPSVNYPAGTQIQIDFPQSEFNNLSKAQTCSVSGGFVTYEKCEGDDNVKYRVTLTTDTDLTKGSEISLTVHNLTNFTARLTSGIVVVNAYYSGVVIDESPDAETNRRFQTTATYKTIALSEIAVDVVTPAEEANYTFKITPTSNFTKDCTLVIQMPSNFPRTYVKGMVCKSTDLSAASDGVVACSGKGL